MIAVARRAHPVDRFFSLSLVVALLGLACTPPGAAPAASAGHGSRQTVVRAVGEQHVLSGVVFGGGQPLAGVSVEALVDGTTDVAGAAVTSASGLYQMALDPGTYDLSVVPAAGSGFAPDTIQNVVLQDADARHDVILIPPTTPPPPAHVLSGRVLGAGGVPVPDVSLRAKQGSSTIGFGLTDAAGHFEVSVPNGAYSIDARPGGTLPVDPTVTPDTWRVFFNVTVAGDTLHDLVLPIVRVSGTVQDEAAQVVVDSPVSCRISGNSTSTSHRVTDAAGQYQLLAIAGSATITASPPPASTLVAATKKQTLSADAVVDLTLTATPPDRAVTGYVTGYGGVPVAGASVRIKRSGSGGSVASALSDGGGFFAVAIPDGSYSLDVSPTGEPTPGVTPTSWRLLRAFSVAGDTVIDASLPIVRVEGTVKDDAGLPIPAATVTWNTSGGKGNSSFQMVAGPDGRYDGLLLNERASYIATPPEGDTLHTVAQGSSITLTGDTTFDITLPPMPVGRSVSGRVTGYAGAPAAGAGVSFRRSSGPSLTVGVVADFDGQYQLTLPDGSYTVTLTPAELPTPLVTPESWRFATSATIAGDTVFNVALPVVRVSGDVVDSIGVAVPGVSVRGSSSGSTSGSSTGVSAADGTYALLLMTGQVGFTITPLEGSNFSATTLAKTPLTADRTQHIVLQAPDALPPVIVTGPVVAHVSDTSATIEWTTNEPSDSHVEFGLGGAFDESVTLTTLVTQHSVTLTGLLPDSDYSFRVTSTDGAGNSSGAEVLASTLGAKSTGVLSFALAAPSSATLRTQPVPGDVTAPVLTAAPTVIFRDQNTAIISWQTDEPASTLLEYGTSASLGTTLGGPAGEFTRSHLLRITGLAAASSYSARVSASDPDGNGPTRSAIITFSTTSAPDTAAPVVTKAASARVLGDTSVAISWTTDEPATSGVSFNDGTAFGSVTDERLVTEHMVIVTGLLAGKPYTFTASSTDAIGNGPRLSGPVTATTAAAPDVVAPLLSGLGIADVGLTSAALLWSTDEPATSVVDLGTAANALAPAGADATLRTSHRLLLTGLAPGKTYMVRPTSVDASGNTSSAALLSFRTLEDVPQLSIGDVTIIEGNTGSKTAELKVTLSRASSKTVTVKYASADGTARVSSGDYVPGAGVVTFAAGATSRSLTFSIKGDAVYELNESFTVNLSAPVGAGISDGQGQVTITNDEAMPVLTVADVSINEGNAGQSTATVSVTASRSSEVPIQFSFATRDGTAKAPSDYTARSGALSFVTSTKVNLTVPIVPDKTKEANETFTLVLSAPLNATLGKPSGTITITNDDK